MASYFFDSSAIIKRYVHERGSSWVINLLDPVAGHEIYVASITSVEVVSALVRQGRGGLLSQTNLSIALGDFQHDYLNQYQTVEIISAVISQAIRVAQTHALRGYDAVQLAAAIMVQSRLSSVGESGLTLISADNALNAAASIEGLLVDNPNAYP